MKTLHNLNEWLSSFTAIVGGVCISLMAIHISVDIISRNVFDYALQGTNTFVSNYYMVTASFLALSAAEARRAHIDVEVFTDLLPRRVQSYLSVNYALSALVYGYLTYRSFFEAVRQYDFGAVQEEPTLMIPLWPSYAVLPLGFGIMTFAVTLRFLDYIVGYDPDAVAQSVG
jgi:TRAP-type C4-dicarboxylate transport system permease small subunit